jgi:hypothetical protein
MCQKIKIIIFFYSNFGSFKIRSTKKRANSENSLFFAISYKKEGL